MNLSNVNDVTTVTRRRGRKKGKQGNATLPSAVVAELQKLINRRITRTEELKTGYYALGAPIGSYNYSQFGVNQILVVSPYNSRLAISQGTGQGNRLGNEITVKRARLRVYFAFNPYHATTNPNPQPQFLLWYVFSRRLANTEDSSLPLFFQQGSSAAAPSGTAADMLYDVNADKYILYKKGMLRLGYSQYTTGTGSLANYGYFSNNDAKLGDYLEIDITPFMTKRQIFDDTTNNSLSNNLMEFACWTVQYDGAGAGAAYAPLSMWFTNQIDFTDS